MAQQFARIYKYQALGNTYLVLDPRHTSCGGDELFERSLSLGMPRPKAKVVSSLCDPSIGIGSNGLIFGPLPFERYFGLLIINSDGTTAGFSGNGSRIFAQYLLDAGDISYGQIVDLMIPEEHVGRPASMNLVRVRMPTTGTEPIEVTAPHAPRFGATAVNANKSWVQQDYKVLARAICYYLPALARIGITLTGNQNAWQTSVLVEIGNPHCVTLVDDPNQLPDIRALRKYDDALNAIACRSCNDLAPFVNGSNLQWAWAETRTRLHLSIYERGEGPTPASGSSACAAACAAYALDLIEERIDVIMPGGTLAVSLDGPRDSIASVTLAGFATKTLDGTAFLSTHTSG